MKAMLPFLLVFLISCGSRKTAPDPSGKDTSVQLSQTDSSSQPLLTGTARQVNRWLVQLGADSLKPVTDTDAAWPKDIFDYFIAAKRSREPDYPYIAVGDFNGDGLKDYAALVRHKGKPVYGIALINGDSTAQDRLTCWYEDIDICAVSLYPRGKLAGIDQPVVQMRGDGVNVEYFEKASFVIYWDGRTYTRTYTGD